MRKIHKGNGHAPWWPCFLKDKIRFSYFGRIKLGHSVIISTNYFVFWPTVSQKIFKFFVILIGHMPCRPCFLMDQTSFRYFCRGLPNIYFCQIIFNSELYYICNKGNCLRPLVAMFLDGSNLF